MNVLLRYAQENLFQFLHGWILFSIGALCCLLIQFKVMWNQGKNVYSPVY